MEGEDNSILIDQMVNMAILRGGNRQSNKKEPIIKSKPSYSHRQMVTPSSYVNANSNSRAGDVSEKASSNNSRLL